MTTITCAHCGKQVAAKSKAKRYCIDCSIIINRQKTAESNARRKAEKEAARSTTETAKIGPYKPSNKPLPISEVVRMARNRGISYGEMVARMKGMK